MRKRLGMFFILLLLTLTMSFNTPIFAGGSSGGSGSGYVSSRIVSWEIPPITKQIILPDDNTQFRGDVTFDVKITLLAPGPQGPNEKVLVATKTIENAFKISFTGNETVSNGSVENEHNIDKLVHDVVNELESKNGKHYTQILVEVKERESSIPGLSLFSPGENLVRIIVNIIPGPPQPPTPPKISMPDMDLDLEEPQNNPVEHKGTRFINKYTPDKPKEPECPKVCPNPNQGNCKQNTGDTPCKSGCPDINININNENNSSANNNNVNNNTNVGRDQYNVNQNANPNPNLKLDRYNHFVYVHGYPDRSFRPEGTITRGEMTAIFRRLLDQGTFMGGNSTAFRDVRSGDWYASDVDRLSTLGVISGYPDGSFRPNASVTRGEFASVAAKFVSAKSGQGFSDLNGHWAQNAIEKLNAAGWVSGYGDGSFRPDAVITRAEVVSIVNRMLERTADAGYVQNHRGSLIQYTDLSSSHWAYLPIMEASNAHDYTRNSDGSETWTRNWK